MLTESCCRLRYALVLAIATLAPEVSRAQVRLIERSLDQLPTGPVPSQLGKTIAIDGKWAVAGAHHESTATDLGGAVVVYERSQGGWAQHSVLRPSSASMVETFGDDAVAIRGGTLAVGSALWRLNEPTGPRGRVHLFEHDGTSWSLATVLVAPDHASIPAPYNGFGYSVTLTRDDELLVGAPSDGAWLDPNGSGSFYVFRRDAVGTWAFVEKVRADPPFDQVPRIPIGAHLEVFGDHAACLRHSREDGPVAILERDAAGHWAVVDTFDVPLQNNSSAHWDFDMNDEFLVIGDEQSSWAAFTGGSGRVLVLQRQAAQWVHIQTLESHAPYAFLGSGNHVVGDGFGRSVHLEGRRLVVGAMEGGLPGRDGSAEVFRFDGTQFVREFVLVPSRPFPSQNTIPNFGDAIAIADHSVLVGSSRQTTVTGPGGPYRSGAVYFYDLPRGTLACSGETNSTGQPGTLAMFGPESLSIGEVYGTAQGLPVGTFCLPVVGSATAFVPAVGGGEGNLCVGGMLGRFNGQLGPADAFGEYTFHVDPKALPVTGGAQAIAAGDSWTFQVWYRDQNGAGATHNLTHAVTVTFGD